MKYRLVNIGRGKYNGIVNVKNDGELVDAVGKHLMSEDVTLVPKGAHDFVVTAGMRPVGEVFMELEQDADVLPFPEQVGAR